MSQSSLKSFFTVTKPVENQFQDFVYDPHKCRAFFSPNEYTSSQTTRLITTVDKLRLWYIVPPVDDDPPLPTECEPFEFATNITALLKSHLQKSIRRQQKSAAIRTAFTMCLTSPSELLRRLPVIAIEDVELIPGTSVIVWLMMTISKRPLTVTDIRIVMSYVEMLVDTNTTFHHDRMQPEKPEKVTHKTIVTVFSKFNESCILSEMLALYYRMTFGGMPGDIRMIERALELYIDDVKNEKPINRIPSNLLYSNSSSNLNSNYGSQEFPELMIPSSSDPDFVMASIDFHCYPWMLKKISVKIGLPQSRIKQLNWFCDSCINERKDWTKKRAEQNSKTNDWKAIKPQLDWWRQFIISKIEEQIYE